MSQQPPANCDKSRTLTQVEQFELDRKAFAMVAKENNMFDVIAGFAKTFGRIPSASITTEDGVTTSYRTPPNVTMPKLNNVKVSDTKSPEPAPKETSPQPISNDYSRAKMAKIK